MTIGDRIHAREITHGLNQHALPVNISWIRGALARLFPAEVWDNWDCKNFGHDTPMNFLALLLDGGFEYNAACFTMQPESSTPVQAQPDDFSMGYDLSIIGGPQLEEFIGDFLIEFDIRILGQSVIVIRRN